MSINEDSEKMNDDDIIYGWMVCKLSIDNKVDNIFYGQVSREEFPPSNCWMYLNYKVEANLETNGLDPVLSEIRIDVGFQIADALNFDEEKAASFSSRYYLLSNSPFKHLNGKYMFAGNHAGVPMYRNIREWVLLRCELIEIPDIGITASTSYSMMEGTSLLDSIFNLADNSSKEILVDPSIKDGSYEFKRRFFDVCRAGYKMVNMNQTVMMEYVNNLKAMLRMNADRHLLQVLQSVRITEELSPTMAESAADAAATSEPSLAATGKVPQLGEDLHIDTKVTLSQSIHYQYASQGLMMKQSAASVAKEVAAQFTEGYTIAESEMSLEMTKCIEQREALLHALRMEADALQKLYLSSDAHESFNYPVVLKTLMELMKRLRVCTVDLLEAYGGWTRLIHNKKLKLKKQQQTQASSMFRTEERKFCVVIAYKSLGELYPFSTAVKSSTKRYSRSMQPAKQATELKSVGIFDTKEEAVAAFDRAYADIPLEQILLSDKTKVNKQLVNLRPCRQHYLVRNTGVAPDLPCEHCFVENDIASSKQLVPKIYKEALAQFVYKGESYMDNLWRDTNFLDEVVLLKRAFPREVFVSNPLMLNKANVELLLESIISNAEKGKRQGKNPLSALKSAIELLHDAKVEGTHQLEELAKKKLMEEYLDSPFRVTDAMKDTIRSLDKEIQEMVATQTVVAPPKLSMSFMDAVSIEPSSMLLSQSMTQFPPPTGKKGKKGQKQAADKHSQSASNLLFATAASSSPLVNTNLRRPFLATTANTLYDQCFVDLQENSFLRSQWSTAMHILGQIFPDEAKEVLLSYKPIAERPRTTSPSRASSRPATSSTVMEGSRVHSATSTVPGSTTDWGDKSREFDLTFFDDVEEKERNTSNAKNLTSTVKAFYNFRGTDFAIEQQRPPVGFRIEGVFCRSDEGEWKGLQKGRAARAYEFQENLYQEGKRKEAERKRLQQLIRKAISVHVVACDVPYLLSLIDKARTLRGSVLALDIVQAENFIRHHTAVIRVSTKVQAKYRGDKDRKVVKKMIERLAFEAEHKELTEFNSSLFARQLVPKMLESAVQLRMGTYKHAIFRITVNMSGEFCVVSFKKHTRSFRKPVEEVCISCQTKSLRSVYEKHTDSTTVERKPCTCRLLQLKEMWRVVIYNPLTRHSIVKIMTIDQIRHVLISAEDASTRLMAPENVRRSLVGTNFDRLAPLFFEMEDAFNGKRLDRSYSMARLNAAYESAVLPLLPKFMLPQISKSIHVKPCLMNGFMHWLTVTEKPMTSRDYGYVEIEEDDRLSWSWQPFADMEQMQLNIQRVEQHTRVLKERLELAHSQLEYHEKGEVEAMEVYNWTHMVYEDARALLLRTAAQIDEAERYIAGVMSFSKSLLHVVSSEERSEVENWAQSYDGVLEDGDKYKGLNRKRRLVRLYEEQYKDFVRKWKAAADIHESFFSSKEAVHGSKVSYVTAKMEYEAYLPTILTARQQSHDMKWVLRSMASIFISTYSQPRKQSLSNPRRLQRLPYNLVFIREPLERVRKEYRMGLAFLNKKVMTLRPIQNTLDRRLKSCLRCVIVVSMDALTGNFVIYVGQEELSVEESVQHLDFGLEKADFSDLTSHALDQDIVLRPQDVQYILSKPIQLTMDTVKTRPKKQQFLLPSQRRRSLKNVRSMRNKKDKYAELASTFKKRRADKEEKDVDVANRLMQYLRLQPHTGRPCLGLLHFSRRIQYSTKHILQCMWLSDLVHANPVQHTNDVAHEVVYKTANSLMEVDATQVMRHFEVFMRYPYLNRGHYSLSIEIAVERVFQTLYQDPLLCASFLWELVTNTYSPQLISHITRHIDVQVPGQVPHGWRHMFDHEIPVLRFLPEEQALFKVPLYQGHRFLAGRYYYLEFSVTDDEHLLLHVTKPRDKKFWSHRYTGEDLSMTLSRHEIIAIVAKVSTKPKVIPGYLLNTLHVLHPNNFHALLDIIVDLLQIDEAVAENAVIADQVSLTSDGTGQWSFPVKLRDARMNTLLQLNMLPLLSKVRRMAEKYNHWLEIHALYGTLLPRMEPEFVARLQGALEEQQQEPALTVKVQNNRKNLQMVLVQAHSFSLLDLEKYYGDAQRSLHKHYIRWLEYGLPGAEVRELLGIHESKVNLGAFSLESLMNIGILTDIAKEKLFVDIKPLEITSDVTQKILSRRESEEMAREDEASRVAQFEQLRITLLKRLRMVADRMEVQERRLRSAVLKAQSERTAVEKLLEEAAAHFTKMVDHCYQSHATLLLEEVTQRLIAGEMEWNSGAQCGSFLFDDTRSASGSRSAKLSEEHLDMRVSGKHDSSLQSLLHSVNAAIEELQFKRDMRAFPPGSFRVHAVLRRTAPADEEAVPARVKMEQMQRRALPSTATLDRTAEVLTTDYRGKFRDESAFHRNRYLHPPSSSKDRRQWHPRVSNRIIRLGQQLFVLLRSHTTRHGTVVLELYDTVHHSHVWMHVFAVLTDGGERWLQDEASVPSLGQYDDPAQEMQGGGGNGAELHADMRMAELLTSVASCVVDRAVSQAWVQVAVSEATASMESRHENELDAWGELTERLQRCAELFDFLKVCKLADMAELREVEEEVEAAAAHYLPSRIPAHIFKPVAAPTKSSGAVPQLGFYIPQDQALPVQLFESNSRLWLTDCAARLKVSIDDLQRTQTFSCVVFANRHIQFPVDNDVKRCIEDNNLNVRTQSVVHSYSSNVGYREGRARTRFAKQLHREKHIMRISSSVYGDIVVMVRRTEDVPLFQKLFQEQYEAYEPIRELRLLREGRERSWRISNHMKYRALVFSMAEKILAGITTGNDIGYLHSERAQECAEFDSYLLECRVLFTQFAKLLEKEDLRHVSDPSAWMASINSLQRAFLLDETLHLDDDLLLMFDEPFPEQLEARYVQHRYLRSLLLELDQHVADTAGDFGAAASVTHYRKAEEGREAFAVVTTGQLAYAMVQLHCQRCTVSMSTCRFPCCSYVRSHMQQARESNEGIEIEMEHNGVRGPSAAVLTMERCIKEYFLNATWAFHDHLQPLSCDALKELSVEEEVQLEKAIDAAEQKKAEDLEALKLHWRDLLVESHEIRTLNALLVSPAVKQIVNALDLLHVKGGITHSDMYADIQRICGIVTASAAAAAAATQEQDHSTTGKQDDEWNREGILSLAQQEDISKTASRLSISRQAGGSALHEIPMFMVQGMIDPQGRDAFGGTVPPQDLDPYPSKQAVDAASGGKQRYPMSIAMFQWICSHLMLTRQHLLPFPASGFRGQSNGIRQAQPSFRFDRMHGERILHLQEEFTIVVQVLQGIFSSASLINDEISGAPPGAIRYVPTSLLSSLVHGLTIVVYDVFSNVTRCIAIEERAIQRITAALEVSASDYVSIALYVLEHAAKCINLSRVGGFCTSALFNITAIGKGGDERSGARSAKFHSENGRRKESHPSLQSADLKQVAVGKKLLSSNSAVLNRMGRIAAMKKS